MPHVRKGDLVVVISGAYKGKRGKILRLVGDRDRFIKQCNSDPRIAPWL